MFISLNRIKGKREWRVAGGQAKEGASVEPDQGLRCAIFSNHLFPLRRGRFHYVAPPFSYESIGIQCKR